jgi:hypothetical protein
MVAQAGNQRGKEVRPEDKMAANSQNGDIITLSRTSSQEGSEGLNNSMNQLSLTGFYRAVY